MRNNLNNYGNAYHAISPDETTGATTTQGTGTDTQGYDELLLVGHAGAIGGTSVTWKVQDCATLGGVYADITGATTGVQTGANAVYLGRINLAGAERFIKVVQTTVGEASAGCTMVLTCKGELPSGMTTQFDVTDASA